MITDGSILGVEYYRPPNPDVADWPRDLKRIKEAGLSLIRTWLHWQQVNPREGKWDFSKIDLLFELARKNGIKILVQLNIEVPPEWLIRKYPEGRWVDDKGEAVTPSSHAMVQVGTYPGLTPDFPKVRELAEEFLRRTVENYKGHPALFGYDVWNEIMPFYGFKSVHAHLYHPETQKKFRGWLQKRYGRIGKVNASYLRNYQSFEEVPMPAQGVYLEMLDVYEFAADWIAEYMNWKVEAVRASDRKHPVVSHLAGNINTLLTVPFDAWEVAKPLDIWGTSCYEIYFWRAAFLSAATRDSAQGRPWGFVEMTGGRTWWGPYGGALRTPEFLEQLPLLAISYGGKFNLFWQWRPERFGQESPNFGLVNEDGSFNNRTNRVAGLAKCIERNRRLFEKIEFPTNDVGLLLDWRSFGLEEISSLQESERFVLLEYLGWFQALSRVGVNVEMLYGSQVAKRGVPKNIKLLITPLLNIERTGVIRALEKYVLGGGHFVAGPHLFTYDSLTYIHSQTPPAPMQKIFGSRRVDLLYPSRISLEVIGSSPSVSIPGHNSLEVYECKEALPWLCSGGLVTGTKRVLGKSICYRVGSLVGSPLGKIICYPEDKDAKSASDGLSYLLKDVLAAADCSHQPVSTGNVLVRLGKSGNEYLLFVHNTEEHSQDVWISIDIPAKSATDLIREEKVELSKGRILISLESRESKVLRLS